VLLLVVLDAQQLKQEVLVNQHKEPLTLLAAQLKVNQRKQRKMQPKMHHKQPNKQPNKRNKQLNKLNKWHKQVNNNKEDAVIVVIKYLNFFNKILNSL
jgi:hypothetical protein